MRPSYRLAWLALAASGCSASGTGGVDAGGSRAADGGANTVAAEGGSSLLSITDE
jgi:hypothetical protein